ncbi:radical SAM protein [Terriglobus sp.]|uniref:radical SAM protein n=1 Tax=Terriglobus sp. TaxID=1889013 RepID=UPI003B0067CB
MPVDAAPLPVELVITSLDTVVKPAPWMCWRSYTASDLTNRSVLQSEKTHVFALLEDRASMIWQLIEARCTYGDLIAKCQTEEWNLAELASFIAELGEAEFIVTDRAFRFEQPEATPTPQRLEFAENTDEEQSMMQWAAGQGFLWATHWEMTFRCNERCVHCYNPGAAHEQTEKPKRDREELTTQEAFALLEDLRKVGVFRLTLSGGEVTLRPDLLEILRFARSLGFSVALYTNGLRLTEGLMEELSRLYPTSISLSVYSTDAETHDEITGVKGSHSRTMEAAQRVRRQNIKLYIKSSLLRHTASEYPALIASAGRLGAAPEIDMHLSDGADGARIVDKRAIDDPRTVLVMALTSGSPLYVGSKEESFGFFAKDKNSTVCGAGGGVLYIDPEGYVSSCSSLPARDVNIRNVSLIDFWGRTTFGARRSKKSVDASLEVSTWQNQLLSDYEECGTHKRCGWCAKCPGMAFLEHGDRDKPASLNCFHAGAKMLAAQWLERDLDIKVIGHIIESFAVSAPLDVFPLIQIKNATTALSQETFIPFVSITSGLELACGSRKASRFLASLDDLSQHVEQCISATAVHSNYERREVKMTMTIKKIVKITAQVRSGCSKSLQGTCGINYRQG